MSQRDKVLKQREDAAKKTPPSPPPPPPSTSTHPDDNNNIQRRLRDAELEPAAAKTEARTLRARAVPPPVIQPLARTAPMMQHGTGSSAVDGSLGPHEIDIDIAAVRAEVAKQSENEINRRMEELERKLVLAEYNQERVEDAIRGHELTVGRVDQNKRAEIRNQVPWWEGGADQNRRGQIDTIFARPPVDDSDAQFDTIDANGDGVIDRSEYVRAALGGGVRHGRAAS